MDRSIEQALRGCGEGEVVAAPGLLDQVRRRMFGLAPPTTSLGRYRLFEVVGAGGGGVVVRAEDPQLGREVAIKLVYEKARGDDDAARRLLREARALARLSHPDIVTIYDVGRVDGDRDTALERLVGASVDGSVYLVMQWCDGGDLSQWLGKGERSWIEIVDAFVAAARGLAAAHAAGLLHRDFKPANVLLDRAGRPRVADFGLGRVEQSWTGGDHDALLDARTRTDMVVGTPMYMSPEQHLGDAIDARSDQYSFCFALREALFGSISFASLTDLVRAKIYGLPPVEARGVPRSIARVIARGLARDPARRWPSMTALLAALARARRPPRRGPLVLVLGGVALLGAALGPRATPAADRRDEPGTAEQVSRPPSGDATPSERIA
ncbi:MAG TPA: serine/threonine-protein kinase, partial [Nannocystaceae bacterium]|nr:serine/threonine-protein kinase [Nannocystaceae bacterium]